MTDAIDAGWLLLIHQIPPKPSYFRVKVWRRLRQLGAVAIKNSVYVLPKSDETKEDFQWVRSEIVESGGECSVCEARFVEGQEDREIEALFRAARDGDYRVIANAAREASKAVGARRRTSAERRREPEAEHLRLKRRMAEAAAIDFFAASGRKAAEESLAALEARLREGILVPVRKPTRARREEFRGRTWVTRKSVFVDRIASAWLIERFIDTRARFKFVAERGYLPRKNEVRFDMFEAEFTHEGDRCTFEVLVERFGLTDPALRPLFEIVHDIDLKDSKFGRRDSLGFEQVLAGMVLRETDDRARLAHGAALFDDVHAYFKRSLGREP